MTTTFQRTTPRGIENSLAEPLPPSLAEQVRERSTQHRKIAEQLARNVAKAAELTARLREEEQADAEAQTQAALSGETPKRRQAAASHRTNLDRVEHEVAAFQRALAKNANGLLAFALPHVETASTLAAKREREALDRAREFLLALDGALAEAGAFAAERHWLANVDGRSSVAPFRDARDRLLDRLRADLARVYEDGLTKRAEVEGEVEKQRAWIAEEQRLREQHAESDRRRADAERVVVEGMRVVERGGHPVGPGGEFQDGAEDD